MDQSDPICCVVYAAKSTEDKRGSIPDQLRECREAIDRDLDRCWSGEYVDESFSAYTGDRGPGLVEAMRHVEDLAEEHGTAELWAQHSDRLARGDGRSARHAVEIALWALKRAVAVRTLQDPDTFRDLLYAVVTGQRNYEDSHRKARSVAGGIRRAAERGEHLGNRPDGYRFAVGVDAKGTIVKLLEMDPEREPIIRGIFELALEGLQPGRITRVINERGWLTPWVRGKPPCPWRVQQICSLLRNPRYAGLSPLHDKVVARGQWPAYITVEQFHWIIGRIGAMKVTKHRRIREPYLLARLGRCGVCGEPLYAMTGHERQDGTFLRRYACASHIRSYQPVKCAMPLLPAPGIEAMLVASLRTLLIGGEEAEAPERPDIAGWTRSFERARVLEAVAAGNDHEINGALEQLFARMSPEGAVMRQLAISQRSARRLEAVQRFEAWAKIECNERTTASRAGTVRLNRLLRSWFSRVAVTMDEQSVTLLAERRTHDIKTGTITVEAHIDWADWARKARLEGRRHPPNREWSRPEILGALRDWVDLHGRSPRFSDWRESGPFHPASLTVRKYFGTWPDALRLAGVPVTHPETATYTRSWSQTETLQAIRDWTDDHGRPPTTRNWKKASAYWPCAETVRRQFGSLDEAVRTCRSG